MSFEHFLELAKDLEGGAVNDSRDPGGETFCGVTRSTYRAFGRTNWPPSDADIAEVFEALFWKPYRCAELPEPADAVFGQLVINLPSNRRIEALQAAVGTLPDGKWGADTTEAIETVCASALGDCGGKKLALLILAAQLMHYADVHPAGDWDSKGLFDRVYRVRKWLQVGHLGG